MRKGEGSIYSLDTINNGPSCKNGKKSYLKCTMTSLTTLSLILFLCLLHCSFTSVTQKHLEPSSLSVQLHKNHSIWFRNEENIKKCSIINTCLMMGDYTLHEKFWLLGDTQIRPGTSTLALPTMFLTKHLNYLHIASPTLD
jgi:hypothetical protein